MSILPRPAQLEPSEMLLRLDQLSRIVVEARQHVEAGRVVNLHGLDQQVDTMLLELTHPAHPDRAAALPRLAALMGQLDALTDVLRQQHELMAGLNQRQHVRSAAEAYGKAIARAAGPPRFPGDPEAEEPEGGWPPVPMDDSADRR